MIKVNLSSTPKQLDISNIGGFDFTKIKIVFVGIAILSLYLPEIIIYPMWETSIEEKNNLINVEQQKLSKLKRSIGELDKEEKQVRELKIQEENLKKKLIAVKNAITEKKNPSGILLYIAKNIPSELWIKELSIENDVMIIKGEASSYTSVGNFVSSLKSSVFIKEVNIEGTNSTVRESDKKRIESFAVKFAIARYE